LTLVPGAAPRTDVGSFEIAENNGNRDVYLYWQAIPQNQENGDNFKYQIIHVEENGHKVTLTPSETTRTYAKLKGISLNSYRFEIISTNEIGASSDRERIYLPKQQESEYIKKTDIKGAGQKYISNHLFCSQYRMNWRSRKLLSKMDCMNYLGSRHL
jgi:hypothetical protein